MRGWRKISLWITAVAFSISNETHLMDKAILITLANWIVRTATTASQTRYNEAMAASTYEIESNRSV